MELLSSYVASFKSFLWNGPILLALLGSAVWLSLRFKGFQFRYLYRALLEIKAVQPAKQDKKKGDISPFAALMTSLAGAIGTGNIAGVAIALGIGGLGALFWLWVTALLCLILAFSEATLAVCFRVKNSRGEMIGGPMETLARGLESRTLALLFSAFGVCASFGIGATVQSNSVAKGLSHSFGFSESVIGIVLMLATAAVVLGGIKSIGKVASILVPFMALLYVGGAGLVVASHLEALPRVFGAILESAFDFRSLIGGGLSSSFLLAVECGAASGAFAGEAGLGSLAIAAASADTEHPAKQGLLAMAGVFLATMVICTMTGLVVGVSGAYKSGTDGAAMTIQAFDGVFNGLGYIVSVSLVFFAFTTTLAWAYYGEKCLEFLLGTQSLVVYRTVYILLVYLGAVAEPAIIWNLAHIANGLMSLPNLVSLLRLHPIVRAEMVAAKL